MNETSPAPASGKVGLASASFIGLVITQFLGALNDNMFRWLAVNLCIYRMEQAGHANPQGLALALGSVAFLLPFMLLAAPAGYLADRFSKKQVIVATKLLEIVVMLMGTYSIFTGDFYLMFIVVFLMGAQSTLFGPAKLGGLPEMLVSQGLPTANGIANLSTMVAVITGTLAGYALYDFTGPDGLRQVSVLGITCSGLWVSGAALIGVALIGWLTSLLIIDLPVANSQRPFPWNAVGETWSDLRQLGTSRALLRVSFGAAFFWSLGCLAQLNVNTYAKTELAVTDATSTGLLLVALAMGVSVGSIVAGVCSRGRPELGMVPIAAAGLAVNAMMLYTSQNSYGWTAFWLFMMGLFGGLYDVPLMAFMQRNSPEASRGSIFAALNFLTFFGMAVTSGVFFVLESKLGLSPASIFLVAGCVTLPVGYYIFSLVPDSTLRFTVWLLSLLFYRVRVHGRNNIPETGGALLVCNHVSWVDGVFLFLNCPRPVRMIAYSENLKVRGLDWMSATMRTIPINSAEGPKALLRSLQTAKQAIADGDLVCIFAEGGISRTGQLQPFQRGMMRIIDGTGCPVIPTYLGGLWGSIFSFRGGKFFWKRPRAWPYPVDVLFGEPIAAPEGVHQVRQAVEELGMQARLVAKPRHQTLPRRMLRRCREGLRRSKIADSTGLDLKGGQVLLRTLALRRLLSRLVGRDENMVGVFLPPSVGGVLANTAITLNRRVCVNLNYTLSADDLAAHIKICGIRHVITSRKFLEKIDVTLPAEMLCLEDLKDQVSSLDKAVAAVQTFATPIWILERLLGLTRIRPDDVMTVIFTSGSTGEPKGVVLSYHNIASNIDAIDDLFNLEKTDVLVGVLPFFHSFGFTGTLWTVLALNPKGVYHYNPLDARVVGKLCQDHGGTILMSTPTFVRSYVKRCDKEQFAKLDLVVTGAEKLPADLAEAFEQKFGVKPSEGYGTTELSPLAAVNVPDHRSASFTQVGTKPGTVGRPVPGVTAKVVDPDTGATLGADVPGLLLIKGPNVMQGYLNRPEKTAEVVHDGWYVTGDIALIDADGFIKITDRQSRFSKIGGEMVPHIKIEELLQQILAEPADEGPELRAVVTAVPDEKKGEKLAVVHKALSKTPEDIRRELSNSGIPNLWVPAADCFIEVEEIPVLGTGKLDLKGIRALARERLTTAEVGGGST